jgi:hypothetical protein
MPSRSDIPGIQQGFSIFRVLVFKQLLFLLRTNTTTFPLWLKRGCLVIEIP